MTPATVCYHAKKLGLPPQRRKQDPHLSRVRPGFLALMQSGLALRTALKTLRVPLGSAGALYRAGLPRARGLLCQWCLRPAKGWHHVSYVPEYVYPTCNHCHLWIHVQMRKARKAAVSAGSGR